MVRKVHIRFAIRIGCNVGQRHATGTGVEFNAFAFSRTLRLILTQNSNEEWLQVTFVIAFRLNSFSN